MGTVPSCQLSQPANVPTAALAPGKHQSNSCLHSSLYELLYNSRVSFANEIGLCYHHAVLLQSGYKTCVTNLCVLGLEIFSPKCYRWYVCLCLSLRWKPSDWLDRTRLQLKQIRWDIALSCFLMIAEHPSRWQAVRHYSVSPKRSRACFWPEFWATQLVLELGWFSASSGVVCRAAYRG